MSKIRITQDLVYIDGVSAVDLKITGAIVVSKAGQKPVATLTCFFDEVEIDGALEMWRADKGGKSETEGGATP